MIAFKGFQKGLICRGYQFAKGINTTIQANCVQDGFHCCVNPLDCLRHYPDMQTSEYCIVDVRGDIDEREDMVSCTELVILKKLTLEKFFLYALIYMHDHPLLAWHSLVESERGWAYNGIALVRGKMPYACGKMGDILAIAKEYPDSNRIERLSVAYIDGETVFPHTWYGVDFVNERKVQVCANSNLGK